MNEAQWKTALFTIGIFSLGAVGVILYQHTLHTGQLLGAIASAAPAPAAAAVVSAAPGRPASLAGTPVWGQAVFTIDPAVTPLQIGSDFKLLH